MDPARLRELLLHEEMPDWASHIEAQLASALAPARHGDWRRWQYLWQQLPAIATADIDLTAPQLRIGRRSELNEVAFADLYQTLRALQPWRKGPYSVFGIDIDSEWRSDWKWQRLQDHIQPLQGRRVLDVGCGNGYHCWRMAGAGARLVLGIDPNLLFLTQFSSLKKLMCDPPQVHLLPLGIEAVPQRLQAFDSVFSMGILYHRRSPLDHLMQLRELLRPGGELVLETLVIEGDEQQVLVPQGRYAKMRNVWFLPSVAALELWLQRCGFHDVCTVDVSVTSVQEQRASNWMCFESLSDFLDPQDASRTIEGYPAPCRAVVLATA